MTIDELLCVPSRTRALTRGVRIIEGTIMKDDTLNAINDAVEALNLVRQKLDDERAAKRVSRNEQRDALGRERARDLPEGYHWTVFDDPDAPRFHVSVSKIVPEGGKLPTPTEEGRLLRIEATKDTEEEGGS